MEWRTSSYSDPDGGNCVEAAAPWRTSSYSDGHGGNCVEVREHRGGADVRDSQHPHLGHLSLPAAEWRAFLHAVRVGEL